MFWMAVFAAQIAVSIFGVLREKKTTARRSCQGEKRDLGSE